MLPRTAEAWNQCPPPRWGPWELSHPEQPHRPWGWSWAWAGYSLQVILTFSRVPETTPSKCPVSRGPEGRVSPRVKGQSTTPAACLCWATSSQTPARRVNHRLLAGRLGRPWGLRASGPPGAGDLGPRSTQAAAPCVHCPVGRTVGPGLRRGELRARGVRIQGNPSKEHPAQRCRQREGPGRVGSPPWV